MLDQIIENCKNASEYEIEEYISDNISATADFAEIARQLLTCGMSYEFESEFISVLAKGIAEVMK